MGMYGYLAELLRYPAPGLMEALQSGLDAVSDSQVRRHCSKFLSQVSRLSLGEWEELYTSALDMNPLAAPYLGFQTWGESYQRGEFMSRMNRALAELDIDLSGELPDHLIPALRYLDAAGQPLPELVEIITPAVKRSAGALRKADGQNPYNHVFDGVLYALRSLKLGTEA